MLNSTSQAYGAFVDSRSLNTEQIQVLRRNFAGMARWFGKLKDRFGAKQFSRVDKLYESAARCRRELDAMLRVLAELNNEQNIRVRDRRPFWLIA